MRVFALAVLLAACGQSPPPKSPPAEAQSYEAAVRILCDVDRLAGVDADDVLDAEAKRTEYLVDHIENGDGIYLLTLFRTRDPQGQVELLGAAVAETKAGECPLLVSLRPVASGG